MSDTDGTKKKFDDTDQSIEACKWRLDQARIASVKAALRLNPRGNANELARIEHADAAPRTAEQARDEMVKRDAAANVRNKPVTK